MDKPAEQSTSFKREQTVSEQEKRARLISRYIENHVVGENASAGKETEKRIEKHYKDKSPKQKADELYQKLSVFMVRRREESQKRKDAEAQRESYVAAEINPNLISRIKVLISDPEVQRLLPETYGEARVDQLAFRASELVKQWRGLENSVARDTYSLTRLRQDIFQEKIKNEDDIEEAKSEVAELEESISEDRKAKAGIVALEGYEKTPEQADTAAMLHYETLLQYREQLDEGFVWLPSREDIDVRAMKVLESGNPKQTRKGVFFISEPGSGKTEQIRAIARRLTGMDRVKISCGPRTGEPQLLGRGRVFPGATEIEKGTFTDYTKAVSGAWTGYDYSYQEESVRHTAQVVELDEMPKAFENETFFTLAKGFFALKDGDDMPGTDKKVLPGRVLIGSGNIGQHHGPKTFPPALEREFIVIPVDYPEMMRHNPELYEFMLAALLEKGAIQASKQELTPAYNRLELPKDKREVLSDGSVVVATEELIEDPTDKNHGFLYRLAHAVKAVQNSYMARGGENTYIDYTKRDILRYKDHDDDTISVAETGEQIILGTTITLNDITGWMIGYKEEMRKKDAVSLSEWLQTKLKEKVEEKREDHDKLKAIFDYFHLFEEIPEYSDPQPLTPKEIGYLSPRVPRPVEVERPRPENRNKKHESLTPRKEQKYVTKAVLLENGQQVLLREQELSLEDDEVIVLVKVGQGITLGGQTSSFVGTIEDPGSKYNGQPIGALVGETGLHRILNQKELELGMNIYEIETAKKERESLDLELQEYCAVPET